MRPGRRAPRGPDRHGHLPARQPRARGLGHQEHGDRSDAWSTPTASTARRGPARVFTTERGRHRRDQGAAAGRDRARATCWCSSAAGRWARAWRRPTRSRRRSSTCRGASTSRCSPTRASRGVSTGRLHRPRRARRRWPAARSASCATATSIEIVDRPRHARGPRRPRRRDGRACSAREGGARELARAGAARRTSRPTRRCPTTRGCGPRCRSERRHLGRLRLRRRRDPARARGREEGARRRARRGRRRPTCAPAAMEERMRSLLVLSVLGGRRGDARRPGRRGSARARWTRPPGDRFNPGRLRSTLVVPQTQVERFRSAVVDAHSHAYAKTPAAIADWVALMDRVGVGSARSSTRARRAPSSGGSPRSTRPRTPAAS